MRQKLLDEESRYFDHDAPVQYVIALPIPELSLGCLEQADLIAKALIRIRRAGEDARFLEFTAPGIGAVPGGIEDADLVLRPPQEDPAHLFALILGAVRAVLIDPIFCRLLQLLEKRINPLLGPCRLERRQTHGFLG